jgi:hypothetical protein
MERRNESGMEAAERRTLAARVEALERRIALLEAERTQPGRVSTATPDRPSPVADAEAEAGALRRRDEARAPRHEGASLRRLGVSRRSEGSSLTGAVRATVLIALGFLVALGVGWVVIVSQPGAGSGWSDAFGGLGGVPEGYVPVGDGFIAPAGDGPGGGSDGGGGDAGGGDSGGGDSGG